jgi:mRNA interferase MazF
MYKVVCNLEQQKQYSKRFYKGDIVIIDFGQQRGSVQGGVRPAVIIQNNTGNRYGTTILVAPITSKKKKNIPTHVNIKKGEGNLEKDSTILMEQVRVVDKSDIIKLVGHITDNDIYTEIDNAILVSFAVQN